MKRGVGSFGSLRGPPLRPSGGSVGVLLLFAGCLGDGPSPGGPCTASRDCVFGEICVGGRCTSGGQSSDAQCRASASCPMNQFCDLAVGLCRPIVSTAVDAGSTSSVADAGFMDAGDGDAESRDVPAICMRDEECGSPPVDICFSSQCIKGCGQPDGLTCTGGTECNTSSGRCEQPQTPCTQDRDCSPPTQICIGRFCQPSCVLNAQLCTETELCDPSTGRCIPAPTPCAMDSECVPPMTVCEAPQCVPGCGASSGGIQCSGQTPVCNPATGRCEAS